MISIEFQIWNTIEQQILALPLLQEHFERPILRDNWNTALPQYAGTAKFEAFLDSFEHGVDIGTSGTLPPGRARFRPPLDLESRIKFGRKILKWYDKGHILGPYPEGHADVQDIREAPVFTTIKPDGGRRPVSDASARLDDGGPSVNEDIKEHSPEKATVQYLRLQQIVAVMILVGVTAAAWAKDLEEGYYNLRVRQDQIKLVAFKFWKWIFIPMVLAMGLSSAPNLFTEFMFYVVMAMATWNHQLTHITVPNAAIEPLRIHFPEDAIVAIDDTHSEICTLLFYLDDMFGIMDSSVIHRQYRMAQKVLRFLGLNAQLAKDRKPHHIQLILGLMFDCRRQHIFIPKEKGTAYIDFADHLLSQSSITKQQLFSLSGKARHIATHIPILAAFARGIELFGHRTRNGRPIQWRHHIHLNQSLRTAITILRAAIARAMTVTVPFARVLRPRDRSECDLEIYTDAAGVHGGIGGFTTYDNGSYFQVRWDESTLSPHHDIHWKEMVAIYVALKLNLNKIKNSNITLWCDNQPVVYMLIGCRAKIGRPDLFWLITNIASMCLDNDIWPWFEWIKGDTNKTADKLSRFLPNPLADCPLPLQQDQSANASRHLQHALSSTSSLNVQISDCVFDSKRKQRTLGDSRN